MKPRVARWARTRWRQVGVAVLLVYIAGPSVEVEWHEEVACAPGTAVVTGASVCGPPRPTVRPAATGAPSATGDRSWVERYRAGGGAIPSALPARSLAEPTIPAAHRVSFYLNNLRVHLLTVGDEFEGFYLDW